MQNKPTLLDFEKSHVNVRIETGDRKGQAVMKKVTEAVLTGIAKISKETAKKDANSACTFLMYQPQIPETVKQLKKYQGSKRD